MAESQLCILEVDTFLHIHRHPSIPYAPVPVSFSSLLCPSTPPHGAASSNLCLPQLLQCFCGSEQRAHTPGSLLQSIPTSPTGGNHPEAGNGPLLLAALQPGSLILSHLLFRGLHHTGTCSQEIVLVTRVCKLYARAQTQICHIMCDGARDKNHFCRNTYIWTLQLIFSFLQNADDLSSWPWFPETRMSKSVDGDRKDVFRVSSA